ncbi:hypothetical protein CN918_27740 [Priestia megaterium]|nr:hypothetical protein CN918_27740 [Priestia megaterium]
MDITAPLMAIILAFTRIASFLYFIPLFQGRSVPTTAKLGISLSIAIYVQDQIKVPDVTSLGEYIVLIIMQVAIGITLGYVVHLIFAIPQIAGSLLDMDMGFSSSQIMDPGSGQRISILANFYSVLFMLVFVMVGGIENLVYSIILSFHFTEVVMFAGNINFLDTLLLTFQYMMVSAVQIALPIICAMFILNIMMLILGKVAPQLNIMLNMFPVKIAVGLLFVYFTVNVAGEFFTTITENLNEQFMDVLESMFSKK